MAEYGDEFVATLEERLEADYRTTFRNYGLDHEIAGMEKTAFDLMVGSLVADAMHPIEQLVATLRERQPRGRHVEHEIVRHL